MQTYKIIAKTNSYIANRDVMFNGNCYVTLEKDLTLPEAKKHLLEMYNEKFEDTRPYAENWGLAVIQSRNYVHGACRTFSDGTRSFSWDSRTFSIEKEIEEEE